MYESWGKEVITIFYIVVVKHTLVARRSWILFFFCDIPIQPDKDGYKDFAWEFMH